MSDKKDVDKIHKDAKPQYVRSRKGANITGDEDATFTTHPERRKAHPKKDS
jgi:hypothetical protein